MTLSTGSSAARAASCPRRGLPRPVQQQHDPPPRLPPAPARRRSLLRRRPIHRRHPSHPFRANGWTACRYLKLLGKCCKLLAQTSRGRRVATYLEVHAAAGKCPHHPELSPPQAVTISYSEINNFLSVRPSFPPMYFLLALALRRMSGWRVTIAIVLVCGCQFYNSIQFQFVLCCGRFMW